MGSPPYQNNQDMKNQTAIINKLASAWKCDFKPLSDAKYIVDYVGHREGDIPLCLVEVKRRNRNFDEFKDILLSVHKVVRGSEFAEYIGVPFFFCVQWNDRIAYRKIEIGEKFEIKLMGGGRENREDELDIDPCVRIPTDEKWRAIE